MSTGAILYDQLFCTRCLPTTYPPTYRHDGTHAHSTDELNWGRPNHKQTHAAKQNAIRCYCSYSDPAAVSEPTKSETISAAAVACRHFFAAFCFACVSATTYHAFQIATNEKHDGSTNSIATQSGRCLQNHFHSQRPEQPLADELPPLSVECRKHSSIRTALNVLRKSTCRPCS